MNQSVAQIPAFRLKKPCANCPFLKVGGIELAPNRLESIASDLANDDSRPFHCHKTVYAKSDRYQGPGQHAICVGSMAYLMKIGRPNVMMRMGMAFGVWSPDLVEPYFDKIIEPHPLESDRFREPTCEH